LETDELWRFLPIGYLATVAIELPVLLIGLSREHPLRRRLLAGLGLTACTYPMVVLVLPAMLVSQPRWIYLAIAETFAPLAECALFLAAFRPQRSSIRDCTVIVVANLLSFGIGEAIHWWSG